MKFTSDKMIEQLQKRLNDYQFYKTDMDFEDGDQFMKDLMHDFFTALKFAEDVTGRKIKVTQWTVQWED